MDYEKIMKVFNLLSEKINEKIDDKDNINYIFGYNQALIDFAKTLINK